jgi:hypothetical protein
MLWKTATTALLTGILLLTGSPVFAVHRKKNIPYNFEILMGKSKYALKKPKKWDQKTLGKIAIAKQMYNINIKFLHSANKLRHIPHIIHIFWIGPKPFPRESIANIRAFKKLHPSWDLIFWTDSLAKPTPIPGMKKRLVTEYDFREAQPFINASTNWGEKTDLMRCVIVYDMGGLYADHDVTPVRSFAKLADTYDFVACFERMQYHSGIRTYLVPANGLFLSKPGHPILAEALKLSMERWHKAERLYQDPLDWHRVIYRTFDSFAKAACALQNHGLHRDLILPTAYFYPNFAFKKKFAKRLQKAGCVYALHGYTGSWKQSRNAHAHKGAPLSKI